MTRDAARLTFQEATAIVAGYGIGGGIMAVPYLASLAGLLPLLVLMVAAYLVSLLLHLMVVEMMLRDGGRRQQVVELLGTYLFRGRWGPLFVWLFFGLLVAAFFGTLTAYLAGGGEIVHELSGLPPRLGQVLFYALAAGVVFFGLKAVGLGEKFAVAAIVLVVGTLAIVSLRLPFALEIGAVGGLKPILALYGMLMFSFFCFFSVPQAVAGLAWRPGLAPRAVAAGIGVTFLVVLVISVVTMGVSRPVTRIAIVGWGQALGPWALIGGSLFVLLAMLTSFWSVSLAMAVVLRERLGCGEPVAWLLSTAPCLVIALSGFTDFLGFLRLTGGLIAILVAIIMVPAYRATRRLAPVAEPAWQLGRWASPLALAILILGYLLVIAGSMVSIE